MNFYLEFPSAAVSSDLVQKYQNGMKITLGKNPVYLWETP